MNFEFGLQHLDIKPHNLFVVSNHLKNCRLRAGSRGAVEQGSRRPGGSRPCTPPPEILRGTVSKTSDQYSLAVVYQQALTGLLPIWDERPTGDLPELGDKPNLKPCPPAIFFFGGGGQGPVQGA